MMSYMELATYLGLVAQTMKQSEQAMHAEGEDTAVIQKMHQALLESQLVLSQMGLNQLMDTLDKQNEKEDQNV